RLLHVAGQPPGGAGAGGVGPGNGARAGTDPLSLCHRRPPFRPPRHPRPRFRARRRRSRPHGRGEHLPCPDGRGVAGAGAIVAGVLRNDNRRLTTVVSLRTSSVVCHPSSFLLDAVLTNRYSIIMPRIDALERGQSQQRDSLSHQAIEDYVKTIYTLAQEESPVSTSRIAVARAVKPASATSMIQRLAKLNLVNYEKHYGVTLTEAGEKLALEVIRHHRLLELYLMEALGFRWDEVHEQADILEHVISEKLEERIAAALNHPEYDPHGDPIPALDGSMVSVEGRPLAGVEAGRTVRVSRVMDDANSDMLRFLADIGLVPGAEGVVMSSTAGQPLVLVLTGAEQEIPLEMAEGIVVEVV